MHFGVGTGEGGLRRGAEARSREAEERLLAIREVAAVGPISRTLGGDPNPAVRVLAARALGSIPGPEAASALVNCLLNEGDAEVRSALIPQLNQREADHVVPRLIRALRSPSRWHLSSRPPSSRLWSTAVSECGSVRCT